MLLCIETATKEEAKYFNSQELGAPYVIATVGSKMYMSFAVLSFAISLAFLIASILEKEEGNKK